MKRMSRAQPGFAAWIMPCELEKLRGGGPLVLWQGVEFERLLCVVAMIA